MTTVTTFVKNGEPLYLKRPVKEDGSALYPQYLPFYDPLEKVEEMGEFEHIDPASRADVSKKHLNKYFTKINELSPVVGTELRGGQLSKLDAAALDELALLAAERGVVVLRDQDYADIGFDRQKSIARHFGPLHVHGWAPHPADGPEEFMIIYDHKDDLRVRKSWKGHSNVQFHMDQSGESQPPACTIICMLESPPTAGGDTIFCSGVGAYNRLSPKFRKRLEGLRAVNSNRGVAMSEILNNGDQAIQRRPMSTSVHPVVAVHPVTRQKTLFVNPVYTEYIVGMQKEESDALLGFLFSHIVRGQDFQCRVRYDAGTVVIWDQRVTTHSQTLDYPVDGGRRHGFRLTALGNKPIPAKDDEEDERLDEYLYD